tara:strand:+ start:696 stop:2297 length:1602 start_codon:yes stop_codon:yes gene_type:complete
MDIKLPNGTVIKGVPEGTPKEAVMQKAISSGLAVAGDFNITPESTIAEDVVGGLEVAGSFGSGIVAEPLAGLAGIAQSINPFSDEGAGADAVKATKEALTYKPRGDEGKGQLKAVGEFLKPVGDSLKSVETALGNATLEATGSPALAAAAHTLPTAVFEALGFGVSKALKGGSKVPTQKQINKAIVESAPQAKELKSTATAIYKEIDEAGVLVKPDVIDSLVNKIAVKTRKKGLDSRVTVKAAGALEALKEMKGSPQLLSELQVQRSIAQQVAKSPDASEAMLGRIMIDELDGFMDTVSNRSLSKGTAVTAKKYKIARQLYGRAKRSETITEAIEKSAEVASGAENGLRIELRKIVNNKKKSKFFTKKEIDSMKDVIRGDKVTDTAKFIGTMGFGSGGGANNLIPLIAASGAAVVNPIALAAPAIAGSIARKIAHKRTLKKADFVDKVVRAGANGNEIVKAYLTSVPKAKRNSADLADLLSDPKINLDDLRMIANETLQDAADIAKGQRAMNLYSGAALGSSTQQEANTGNSQ